MTKKIRYWAPVFFVLGLIFYLSSLPGNKLPDHWFPYQDKVEHFLAYTVVGFVLGRALTNRLRAHPSYKDYKKYLIIAFLLGATYGAFDECHQYFTPERSMELADFIVDCIGVSLGVSIVVPYRRMVLKTISC